MSQATLDDDALFGEAADELGANVREHVDAAWAALPDPEQIWAAESENVLGVLNTLRSGLDVEEARAHVRDAKKWYTLGTRAEAFDPDDPLAEELATLEETIESIEALRAQVGDVASELPAVRKTLVDRVEDQADAT